MPKWLNFIFMVVLKYAPIWDILQIILDKLKEFSKKTETQFDDKLFEVLEYLIHAIRDGEILKDFNNWLNGIDPKKEA